MPELLLIGAPARVLRLRSGRTEFKVRVSAPEDVALDGRRMPGIDGAALLLEPGESPHAIGYALFLGGVRVRVGRSTEFGGLALSRRLPPDADDDALITALIEDVAA